MSAEELMKLYSRENHEKVKDVKESVPDKEKNTEIMVRSKTER